MKSYSPDGKPKDTCPPGRMVVVPKRSTDQVGSLLKSINRKQISLQLLFCTVMTTEMMGGGSGVCVAVSVGVGGVVAVAVAVAMGVWVGAAVVAVGVCVAAAVVAAVVATGAVVGRVVAVAVAAGTLVGTAVGGAGMVAAITTLIMSASTTGVVTVLEIQPLVPPGSSIKNHVPF